jgi:hypothetical protein
MGGIATLNPPRGPVHDGETPVSWATGTARDDQSQGPVTGLRNRVKEVARRWEAARVGLEARDFTGWGPELDAALETLPQAPNCPGDLLRLLCEPRQDTPKRIVLLTERGAPVAVVPLRFTAWGWEPVTTWIVPGPPFPVRDGDLVRALRAVGLPMKIAWWRCPAPIPEGRGIACVKATPTHQIALGSDFEQYWRSMGRLKDIKQARKRCNQFQLSVDPPDGAGWTIRNAGVKWHIPGGITEDLVTAAEWLEACGGHHTLLLCEGDRPVAGMSCHVDQGDLVGHTTFRDPNANWFCAGVFLMDRLTVWAAQRGFARLDLGGGFEYKARWAPEAGTNYTLQVTPLASRIAATLRGVRHPAAAAASQEGSEAEESPAT